VVGEDHGECSPRLRRLRIRRRFADYQDKTRQDEKSLAEFARRYDAPRSAIAICGSTEAVVVCNSPCLQLRCGWSDGMQAGWSLRMVSDLCRAAPQR